MQNSDIVLSRAMSTATPPPRLIHWVLMLSVALVWGTSFMFVELALRGFGPFTIVAGRITLAALVLIGLSIFSGRGLPPLRGTGAGWVWLSAFALGVFSNALPFLLLSWSQQFVASGFAGVCMAAVPLLVLPLAHFLVPGETMSWLKTIGFITGFVGVFLLIGWDAFESLGTNFESTARIACVGAACCYAIGNIITRLCPPVRMISLAAATMGFAALISLPMAIWLEGWPAYTPLGTASIVILGLFATAGALLVQVKIVREAGPTFMVLVNYQVPAWSLFFGWSILNEHLPATFFAALLLILLGMALSQWRTLRALYGMLRR